MPLMQLEVRQSDIDKAIALYKQDCHIAHCCPIATAANRSFQTDSANMGFSTLVVNGKCFQPKENSKIFVFTLARPAEWQNLVPTTLVFVEPD